MLKRQVAITTLIIYTVVNLSFIGWSLIQLFDVNGSWLKYLVAKQGGLIYLGIILALFLNAYLIIKYTTKD